MEGSAALPSEDQPPVGEQDWYNRRDHIADTGARKTAQEALLLGVQQAGFGHPAHNSWNMPPTHIMPLIF